MSAIITWASRLLILYAWGAVAVILFFLFVVARFYEQKARQYELEGQRSLYQLFLVPLGCFILGALRYAWLVPRLGGDLVGDFLFLVGGVLLTWLCYRLECARM